MKKALAEKLRQHHDEEVDSEGTWAISYGDMVTLLLTFFIVFFSVNPDSDATRKARSLQVALLDLLNERSTESPTTNRQGHALAVGEAKEAGVSSSIADQLKGRAHRIGDHLIVEFPGVSFFGSAQVSLTSEGEKALAEFVRLYLPYAGQNYLSIRAFTDRKPVLGGQRFKDNLELSALRSVSAMRHLQKAGMPLNRMRLGGLGEHETTERELNAITNRTESRETAALDLARKVVLVIESEAL